ncbi:MAG: penicillin-binding protein [Erysipelotrichaceae bacterium]|nr:penicillin-binding protein [Erysipelotrichaceae bacterium]
MKRSNDKLRFLYIIFLTVCAVIIVNVGVTTLMKIHLRSMTSLDDYVNSVSNVDETIFASRGMILDTNGQVLAQDVQTYDIICYLDKDRLSSGNTPAYVDNPSFAANALAPILGMDASDIYTILTSNDGLYQVELGAYGRNLSEEQKNEIEAIDGLHGIDFRISYTRYYPYNGDISPQLVGFAKSDDTGKLVGQLGIEAYLNDELSGTDGTHSYQQDKHGYVLPGMYEETVDAVNGYDVYLTLDVSIQEALNTCLQTTMDYKGASRAWGAVVEVKTGKILAWGQIPSYNPNNITSEDTQVNFGSQLAYEPGSVMKSIIYSAAMDLGVYDGDTEFNSGPFCYDADAKRTYSSNALGCIYNVSLLDWGNIPLDYGLIYSSNVATATLLSQYVGQENYKKYLEEYHLYQCVNTDGIDEIPGYTNYGLSPVDSITATYGQGSSTTMLQLLQAYTAIFGNGEMLKPYLIDKIVDPNTGSIVYQGRKTVVSNPISSTTAKRMQDLLRRVVAEPDGTCRHYAAKTVQVMGKTGTGEIPEDGGYSLNQNIISCMLGFPYEDPQYIVYYAYVSAENLYYNYDIKPVPDLIDRIALLEGLAIEEGSVETYTYMDTYEMPSLLSSTYDEALNTMSDMNVQIIRVGDGNNVTGQYPEAGSTIHTDEKIFIQTDSVNIEVPDFSGWTRKEIVSYWSISHIPITIDGYGVAYEQSISPKTVYDGSTELIVKLKDIQSVAEEEPADDSSADTTSAE